MNDPCPTMNAVVFDAPAADGSTTRIAALPIPEPHAGEVSIDVHYAGVNFKDVMARRGDPGYVTAWPFVPGLEVAGTIRSVGTGVSRWQPGDYVSAFTGSGGLAEVAVASAALSSRVPTGLDLARAATAPGALTSASLLVEDFGRLHPEENVLIHGAGGGVGHAALALARRAGAASVIGTVGHPDRIGPACRAGFDAVLARSEDWVHGVRRATAGRGVDLVLDPQGTALLEGDLAAGAPGVRVILFGNATGGVPAALPGLPQLMGANASLHGFSLAALAATDPHRVSRALSRVLDQLAAGAWSVETTVLDGLGAAPAAHQRLVDGNSTGKYLVRLR